MTNEELQQVARNTLGNFFSEYPLYRTLEIDDTFVPLGNKNISYNAYCECDKEITTFTIENQLGTSIQQEIVQCAMLVAKNVTTNDPFSLTCNALCQKCRKYKRYVLLYFESTKSKETGAKFTMRKIGQYPAPQVKADNILKEFLTKQDLDYYVKAKTNLNFSYGIGAFAYFRRIVENEILHILNDQIANNPLAKTMLEPALEKWKVNHQMTRLLEEVGQFLPKGIFINGTNPLVVLYNATSDGIHNLTEEQCVDRSIRIEKLLKHVIVELRKQETIKEARDALNDLLNL